jgi:hypothetical protein
MENKLRVGLLILLALIITASAVLGAVEIEGTQVEFDVDYNDFNDEDQTVIRETFDLSIRNTEVNLVTVGISITGLPSRYNVPALNSVTIPAGETRVVAVEINVPHLQSSGEKQIGTIIITDTTSNVQYSTKTLVQDTKSMIGIDELKVDYETLDGNSETDTFSGNRETVKLDEDVRPGSEVTISLNEIENLFDKDYDDSKSDIESITVKIEVDDDDLYAESFEEEYDLSDLSAEEKDNFEVTFTIDPEADDKEYVFDIEIEGEDGKGAKHTLFRELTIKVERNKDDIRITKFEITPENVHVCESNVKVDVKLMNLGTRDQKNVAVQLFSDSLGIIQNIANIELEKFSKDDNTYARTFTFDFNKKNVEVGRHEMDINVFINNDERQDSKRVILNVGKCIDNAKQTEEIQTEGDTTPINNDNTRPGVVNTDSKIVSSGEIVKTVEDPYTSEDVLVSVIVICIILLLALIAIFTIILTKNHI